VTENRVPPQDVEAEQALLGGCLLSQDALDECRQLVSATDWYRPAHALIWAAALALHENGEPADAITVAAALVERGEIARAGGYPYLHTLISSVPTAANATYYAQIVADKAVLRQLTQAATKIAQLAYNANEGMSLTGSIADVVAACEAEMVVATQMAIAGQRPDGLMTWADFIIEHAGADGDKRKWVVPGMISERDVVMVLAPPGAGKTTLSRQVCLSVAAGLHPFILSERIEPLTTLLVDLENDPATAAGEATGPLSQVRRYGELDDGRAWIWSRIDGVNLRKPAEVRIFEQVIAEVKPSLVAFGSLYKAGINARAGENYELAATEVRDVFDRLRRRYGFALWLEHHMPKDAAGGRKKNPFGSSVWEWWPSHGRILERAVDNAVNSPFSFGPSFRADRGERAFPVGFTRGGVMPWSPIWTERELNERIKRAGG